MNSECEGCGSATQEKWLSGCVPESMQVVCSHRTAQTWWGPGREVRGSVAASKDRACTAPPQDAGQRFGMLVEQKARQMAGTGTRSLLPPGPLCREGEHKQTIQAGNRAWWWRMKLAVTLPLRDSAGLVLVGRHQLPPSCTRASGHRAHLNQDEVVYDTILESAMYVKSRSSPTATSGSCALGCGRR